MKKRSSESRTESASKKQTIQEMEKPQPLWRWIFLQNNIIPFLPLLLHLCYQDFSAHVRMNKIAFLIYVPYTSSLCGVVALLWALKQKVLSSKLYRSTTGIHQEGHLEFKLLRCSSKKSGLKTSV